MDELRYASVALPFALRPENGEITEADIELLVSIAADPTGPGHLTRPTPSVPPVRDRPATPYGDPP